MKKSLLPFLLIGTVTTTVVSPKTFCETIATEEQAQLICKKGVDSCCAKLQKNNQKDNDNDR